MTLYIIGALILWLVGGVIVGVLIGPRLRDRTGVDYEDMIQ
jgi:hypothetical protein